MTDTKQPEALRLADELCEAIAEYPEPTALEAQAAAELRRQHARITELEAQLAQRFDAADMATAAAQGDALTPGDADQLEKVITDFEDCGETDVPDETLQRFAAMGYLECVHYNVLPVAHEAIDAARTQAKKGGA